MAAAEIQLAAGARRELRESFDWYAARSRRAAARFLAEIERALELIRTSPGVWPTFEAGTRRYVLSRFPYSVIYRIDPDFILVIAVAHQRRRPGYWQDGPSE